MWRSIYLNPIDYKSIQTKLDLLTITPTSITHTTRLLTLKNINNFHQTNVSLFFFFFFHKTNCQLCYFSWIFWIPSRSPLIIVFLKKHLTYGIVPIKQEHIKYELFHNKTLKITWKCFDEIPKKTSHQHIEGNNKIFLWHCKENSTTKPLKITWKYFDEIVKKTPQHFKGSRVHSMSFPGNRPSMCVQ